MRIQGTGTPTFTVYKLERPTRIVVDVARATLDRSVRGDEPGATFAVNSWAVSQVAAQALEDGSTAVRVVYPGAGRKNASSCVLARSTIWLKFG